MTTSARAICLVSNGPVDDPRTFSGTPYFFWRAALEQGSAAVATDCRAFGRLGARIFWTGRDRLNGRRPGGFASICARRLDLLNRAWRPLLKACRGQHVLNFHQIFPAFVREEPTLTRWAYIDQTLIQLGDYLPDFDARLPAFARILAAERASYASCAALFTMTDRARRSLVDQYGVPPEKVTVVPPGANLAREDIESVASAVRPPRDTFRIAFVGIDWRRKGLPLLIDAVRVLRDAGGRFEIVVIGPPPADLPADWRRWNWIIAPGHLSKAEEGAGFCRTVASADLGVLVSEAEAAGIAAREYQALGLPVLVRNRGGAREMMLAGAGRVLPGDLTVDALAAAIHHAASHPDTLRAQRAEALRQRDDLSWETPVRVIFDRMAAHDHADGQGRGLSL